MSAAYTNFAAITAVLPSNRASAVVEVLHSDFQTPALTWDGRGTLLRDQWWSKWVPPISPAKSLLHVLAPREKVEFIERAIIEAGKLDKQSAGAVISTPCSHTYFGSEFSHWQASEHRESSSGKPSGEELQAIYCIVDRQYSNRVGRAAIQARAHGPVVFLSEGSGLRDRLGWLRITKEHQQDVLVVIADQDDADNIFDAMGHAGQLHLPGRGIMYCLPISKGMFNLPSRMTHHHHEASMQQIIHAIDHLAGHQDWRDQTVFDLPGKGRATGLSQLPQVVHLNNQVCLSVITRRDRANALIDVMLEAGAPGLNFNFARFRDQEDSTIAGTYLRDEVAMLRCITYKDTAQQVIDTIVGASEENLHSDFCMYMTPASRVLTYVPGKVDYRAA